VTNQSVIFIYAINCGEVENEDDRSSASADASCRE